MQCLCFIGVVIPLALKTCTLIKVIAHIKATICGGAVFKIDKIDIRWRGMRICIGGVLCVLWGW